ncbi:hypothetical protein [Pseudomonas monteilii]|uniref:hypothetical protein n=1 Tax=Pseudomonas monteilii TaxID=76759 RepID=UPI0036E71CCF
MTQEEARLVSGMPTQDLYNQQMEISRQRLENAAARLDGLRDEELADLPARQQAKAMQLLFSWLAWIVGTYAAGSLIAWVIKGFRHQRA